MQYLMSISRLLFDCLNRICQPTKYALPLSVEKQQVCLSEALRFNLGIVFGIVTRPYWLLQISKAQTAILD